MAHLSPRQQTIRHRIERAIRLAEPGLNLLLFVGDRVSRVVDSDQRRDWSPRSLRSDDSRRVTRLAR